MKRGEILDSVKKTVTQDRNDRHGEPENSFSMIAEQWNAYIERNHIGNGRKILSSDVAEMMAILKDVRFQVQPENPDNKHDQIGYLAIAVELRAIEAQVTIPNAEKLALSGTYGKINSADQLPPLNSIHEQSLINPDVPKDHPLRNLRTAIDKDVFKCAVFDDGKEMRPVSSRFNFKPLENGKDFPSGAPTGTIIQTVNGSFYIRENGNRYQWKKYFPKKCTDKIS